MLVVDVTGQQFDQQVLLAGEGAFATVVQIAAGEGQVEPVLADQLAATVIEAGGVQQQRAATGQARIVGVDQCTAEGALQAALADQLAAAVVQALADQVDVGRADLAATVEDLAVGVVETQQLAGGNQAVVAVIQAPGNAQAHIALTGDDALGIVEARRAEGLQALAHQGARRVVIEGAAEVGVQAAVFARQRAFGAVVEAAAGHGQTVPAGDQAFVGVDQGVRLNAQLIGAEDGPAITVVDTQGRHAEPDIAGNFALFAVGQVGQARKAQRSFGADQAGAVVEVATLQIERNGTFADQAALALDQLLHHQLQVALGRDFTAKA